jgi:diadenosine tetraphosphate (Ap4A) HIT family hydrolase
MPIGSSSSATTTGGAEGPGGVGGSRDPRKPAVCPFCGRIAARDRLALEHPHAVAFEDAYPLNPGHMLIVSRRHVERLADLTDEELTALWRLVPHVREWIERSHRPDGYNIGLNDGPAAGQTVPHLHLHVIPRFRGDVADPRGGVRHVIPERAAYWELDVDA